VAEAWQYLEVWTDLQAAGGTILGRLLPESIVRRRRLTGDDSLTFSVPRSNHLASSLQKNVAIREILSLDGTVWREWIIQRVAKSSDSPRIAVECISPFLRLTNYPVTTADADGYVYRDTAAIQLDPETVIDTFIRSETPAWVETGTVTPTDVTEVAFSGDSALSGLRRLEEAVPGYEAWLSPVGTTGYGINFTARGGSAPTMYLRPGKQVRALRSEESSGQQVTRVNQIQGADGDDGPSGIAWAYWEVTAISGAGPYLVTLAAIHGGAGPIGFDDQLNGLYLERRDGTFIEITDSTASTQQVSIASNTTISVGDWVRVVADSAGKHLMALDAPAELAEHGLLAGRYESAWDDTVCVVKNALQEAWASTLPDDWTGLGAKSTTEGNWLTSGAALLINQSVTDGAQIAAPPARSWYIRERKTTYSATAWIRLLSAFGAGTITFRVKVGSTVVGEGLEYLSPVNAWRQLKIEGLDLSAYVGTTQTLTVEIVKSGGTGTVNMLVDSMCLAPALSARAVTTGSNAARTWQGVNAFLDVRRSPQFSYQVSIAELARMGVANQVESEMGQGAVIVDDDIGTVSTRVLEIEDDPTNPANALLTLATLPPRFTRAPSKPLPLVVPFFEPIAVRVADRDTRQAALQITASVTGGDDTEVEITLTASDTLGGSPSITYNVFGATYVSGSGLGPYVFTRPASGAGVGRVVFTASLPGRSDVADALDIPEQPSSGILYTECRAAVTGVTATSITVTVTGVAPTGTPQVELVAVTGSATRTAGPLVGVPSASGQAWTFSRGAFDAGIGQVQFRATLSGAQSDDDFVVIPEVGRDTVALAMRCRVIASDATTVTVRVAVADPYPQGSGSVSLTYQNSGSPGVSPGSGGSLTPAATINEAAGTYEDFTVDRPTFGNPPGRVTFTASAANRVTDSDAVDIPAQDVSLPSLSLQVTPGETSYSVAYSGTGTVEASLDGASWAAAAASPIVVSRNAAGGDDQVLSLRATASGQTVSDSVTIPAQDPTGGGTVPPSIPVLYVTTQDNSANTITLAFAVENAPGGYTLDLAWSRKSRTADDGNEGVITGISTTSPYAFDTDTHDGAVDLVPKFTSGYETVTYTFTLRVKDGSTVVATANFSYDTYAVVTY
jgi:hypothetical protein